jgi:hypothetical protein
VNNDIEGTINFTDRRGRLLLVFYGAGTSFVALLNLSQLLVPAFGLAALVLLWVALAILGTAGSDFGPRACFGVLGLVIAITILSAWNLANPQDAGYSNWYLGAVTFVLLVLAVRGRAGFAWLGFGVLAVVALSSTISTEQSFAAAAGDLARQGGTLVIGTLFAVTFRRSARIIRTIQARQVDRIATDAAIAAATRERAEQSTRLEAFARPALQRIADGRPLSEAERHAMALLEAELRDGIRAAGFNTPAITRAVRDARERGVHVALVDDRGQALDVKDLELVEDALLFEVRRAAGGRVTARLSPFDSDEIATIVVARGDDYRSVVVRSTGVEVMQLSGD